MDGIIYPPSPQNSMIQSVQSKASRHQKTNALTRLTLKLISTRKIVEKA